MAEGKRDDRPGTVEDDHVVLSTEEARSGDVVLRNKGQRWVFIAGLVAIVVAFMLAGFLFSA